MDMGGWTPKTGTAPGPSPEWVGPGPYRQASSPPALTPSTTRNPHRYYRGGHAVIGTIHTRCKIGVAT
jgi:hypothetical protein